MTRVPWLIAGMVLVMVWAGGLAYTGARAQPGVATGTPIPMGTPEVTTPDQYWNGMNWYWNGTNWMPATADGLPLAVNPCARTKVPMGEVPTLMVAPDRKVCA